MGEVTIKEFFIEGDEPPSVKVSDLPEELREMEGRIVELKRSGRVVEAIQLARSVTNWGLREIKHYVDSLYSPSGLPARGGV